MPRYENVADSRMPRAAASAVLSLASASDGRDASRACKAWTYDSRPIPVEELGLEARIRPLLLHAEIVAALLVLGARDELGDLRGRAPRGKPARGGSSRG